MKIAAYRHVTKHCVTALGLLVLCLVGGCFRQFTDLSEKTSGKKALATMQFTHVYGPATPDGYTLAPERREQPLNLTVAVRDVLGPYAREYGYETAGMEASAMGGMNTYIRQSIQGPLADQYAEYLRQLNIFKTVTRGAEADVDLIIRPLFDRYEVRIKGTREMFMLMKMMAGDYTSWWEITADYEVDIRGRFEVQNRQGEVIFTYPLSMHHGPIAVELKQPIENNQPQQDPSQMSETKLANASAREYTEGVFAELRKALLAHEAELQEMAGPAVPDMTVAALPEPGPINRRLAVIVGLSRYEHASDALPNLRYADRDAKKMAELLMRPEAGGFPAENIRLLINEDATYRNVRAALFEFLQHAIDSDLVLIYFSGHGVPDPLRPDNLYLMCYDSDPAHVASTALPMRDMQSALQHHIEAQRVIVLADACHSAGITTEGTRAVGVENKINHLLGELSQAKPGRLIFTSSEGNELSQESPRWGEGHGVFTWALLEAISGRADGYGGSQPDGVVTLGETIEYTRDFVRRETANAQHPSIAGTFDRELVMALHQSDAPGGDR